MAVSREQAQAKLDLLASGVTRHVPEQTYLVPDRLEKFTRLFLGNKLYADAEALGHFLISAPDENPKIGLQN